MRRSLACASLLCAICAATSSPADEAADLAQELANPLAAIISVPFQLNYDDNLGVADQGSRTTLNFQPVVPFQLNDNVNLITRTIIPYIWQEDVVPGTRQEGFGDILFSAWFSPTGTGDVTWGVGPVVRIPTFSDVSSDTWAAGITGIALRQTGPWTYGALANHLWDLESNPDTPTNVSFLQPFVAYSTEGAWTYSLQSESTYDWEAEAWSVPVNASVSKLVQWGGVPVNLQGGLGYWLEAPEVGAEGVRLRLQAQVVLPKGR
ncbi:transporter [Ruegeria hyattellae]|uniref:transporter n=1 Tax=Ruegeria hyattellae TaxID=3233337 RepID=UPI00355B1BA2